mmetsp:Transcript_52027/g.120917  ORF Transcript_52027/g.120917 Transcript_52027/m.120917 type:complete len:129 (-) Transcript_52027:1-387(-)
MRDIRVLASELKQRRSSLWELMRASGSGCGSEASLVDVGEARPGRERAFKEADRALRLEDDLALKPMERSPITPCGARASESARESRVCTLSMRCLYVEPSIPEVGQPTLQPQQERVGALALAQRNDP